MTTGKECPLIYTSFSNFLLLYDIFLLKQSSHWTETQAIITKQTSSTFVHHFLSYFKFQSFIPQPYELSSCLLSCLVRCVYHIANIVIPLPRELGRRFWKSRVSAALLIHTYTPKKLWMILPWNRVVVVFSVKSHCCIRNFCTLSRPLDCINKIKLRVIYNGMNLHL